MADRFRNSDHDRQQGRENYEFRNRRGFNGRSEYSDKPTDDRYSSPPGERSVFNRDEGYFGGNRGAGYGEGYGDYEPNRAFGYSWRDSTGHSNYDNPEHRYESTSRRSGFGRDAYGLGYGGDWEPEANRRRYDRDPSQGRDYERDYYRQSGYRSNYPSSESGFETNRENDRNWWDRASDEVSSWFGDEDAERRRQMDARGGHRGRGPKNYVRSDDRIRDDVNERLTDYDYLDASDIEVQVNNSEVVLSGTVETRYEKRAAEDIADRVSGVKNVENRLRIRREQQQTGDWAYPDATGRVEMNQTEKNATHTATGHVDPNKARSKSSSM